MKPPVRILLQTTIPATEDDWSIARFSLLHRYLASLCDEAGNPLYAVTARDRENDAAGNDPVLKSLDRSTFDELWLFAVDVGDGITDEECAAIMRFRQQGGGLLLTRDHQDLGSSLCNLSDIGAAHYFHSKNPDPDVSRHCPDDIYTPTISWPNYHSGRNGDCQKITPVEPIHELLRQPNSPSGHIDFLPAHPHEGAVGIPADAPHARVIATGQSVVSQRSFNLIVVFDRTLDADGHQLGRVVADSTFHHFCDYNWDTRMGCPSFVDEPPGDTMQTEPRALDDLKAYLANLALWLAPVAEG
ncbi:MAG: hypothetical protein IGS38_14675 [Synechococcales cyanobacterium M58_A2018_015]|nr:hypothetical protein [Synechococcales cyanobacterium M58_A2018_015]